MNAIDFFDRGLMLAPDRPCMVDAATGAEHTYRSVAVVTRRVATGLRQRGYDADAKAGVLSLNDGLAYSVVLGIIRSGMTWLSINARNAAPDIGRQMAAFDCAVLFYQRGFAGHVTVIAEAAPQIKEFVCIDGPDGDRPGLDDWLGGDAGELPDTAPDPARPFAIQTTGGTTGLPKGVVMTDQYLETVVGGLYACLPCPEPPVYLAAAPLTHAAGLFMHYVMAQGGTGVLMPVVDLEAILAAIPRHRVTHLFLPPTAIYGLLTRPGVRERDYSSLRYFIYGASPMAPEKIAEAVSVFGPVMCQMYGQTETGLPNTYLSAADHFVRGDVTGQLAAPERLGSCGRPTPFVRLAIMDDEGRLLGDGEVGEIVVRGTGVSPAYHGDPEATAAAKVGGWHRTGDVGVRDGEGYYSIVDRKRDVIISGGFNVYSAEVERAILAHPQVQECAVIGAPDPKWGEAVTAVVELVAGTAVPADEIAAQITELCRTQLGPVRTPKHVDVVDVLPRTPTGKVLKREVRAPYWGNSSRQVH